MKKNKFISGCFNNITFDHSKDRLTMIWLSKSGMKIKICDLNDIHLKNIINYLNRNNSNLNIINFFEAEVSYRKNNNIFINIKY